MILQFFPGRKFPNPKIDSSLSPECVTRLMPEQRTFVSNQNKSMETKETETKVKWKIDVSHSEVGFKVKHLMITNVKGAFKVFDGSIYTTGEDFMTAEVDFFIDVSSVDTGDAKRDEHLKSADFFDVENHKQISFVGNTYEKVSKDHYLLYGDLEIKGIKKQVQLKVEFAGVMKDPWGNEKAGFVVEGKINRKDWGLTWNAALERGGVLVSEDVWINCELQLVRA
jgi:polyisoprenoid-binding protein YceI